MPLFGRCVVGRTLNPRRGGAELLGMSLSPFPSHRDDRGTPEHTGEALNLCVGGATVLLGLGLALIAPWIGLVALVAGLVVWTKGKAVWKGFHHRAVAEVTRRVAATDRVPSMRALPAPVTVQTTSSGGHGRHMHRMRRPDRRERELL